MAYCAAQASSASMQQGRLAKLLTNESYILARGLMPAGYYAWIGMKTTVADSTNWSDWNWYDDLSTPTSTVSFVPAGSNIATAGANCGSVHTSIAGFLDNSCSSSSTYICEFLCGMFELLLRMKVTNSYNLSFIRSINFQGDYLIKMLISISQSYQD